MSADLTFHREGDYLILDLTVPDKIPVGIWGMRRRDYLKRHSNGIYTGMLLSGKLNAHLTQVDQQANEMFDRLTRQVAATQGITEHLKVKNQMAWVKGMNTARDSVVSVRKASIFLTPMGRAVTRPSNCW